MDAMITVPDPDDTFGMPIYEGLASKAYHQIISGSYHAYDEQDNDYTLVVTNTSSSVTTR